MAAKGKSSPDQLPLFTPDSDWKPPLNLPDLSQETEVAIDIETRDDKLAHDLGPGFYQYEKTDTNTGYICGISVAWRDNSIYIPLRHSETSCYDHTAVCNWLNHLAAQNQTRFIFHNFQYDWGWIEAVFHIPPPYLLDDTMAMASMLNENLPSFSLDGLCKWQKLPGKDETLLKDAMGTYRIKDKGGLWKLPAKYVGPYAEQDAASTLKLAQKLRPLLAAEELDTAYQVERDLMPVTLTMKQRGIRVDVDRATKLSKAIKTQCDVDLNTLSKMIGQKVTLIDYLRRSRWLKEQFDKLGIKDYPHTRPTETYEEGQPSFDKNYMANHWHEVPRLIHKIKHQYDLADKFLEKFILTYNHKGRVYPSVNQFRSETGGARSHRFSYSDPPLQQMPSRDSEYADLIRSCFIPEEDEFWCSIDYRQQEYRLIVFVAELHGKRGAHEAANMYRKDPDTDFHDYVSKLTRLERKRAKDTNFAISYGAGVKKFALMTGMGDEEAKRTLEQYNEYLPFVHEISRHYAESAAQNGHITMLDGARNHFNSWEPRYRDYAKEEEYKKQYSGVDVSPCDEEEMNRRIKDSHHPWCGEQPKRAYTHKALNRMIQGSAARQIKKAMVNIWNEGHFPLLQIHDELGFSFSSTDQADACAKIMQEAMPVITIPMLTDVKLGTSWGDLKKIIS